MDFSLIPNKNGITLDVSHGHIQRSFARSGNQPNRFPLYLISSGDAMCRSGSGRWIGRIFIPQDYHKQFELAAKHNTELSKFVEFKDGAIHIIAENKIVGKRGLTNIYDCVPINVPIVLRHGDFIEVSKYKALTNNIMDAGNLVKIAGARFRIGRNDEDGKEYPAIEIDLPIKQLFETMSTDIIPSHKLDMTKLLHFERLAYTQPRCTVDPILKLEYMPRPLTHAAPHILFDMSHHCIGRKPKIMELFQPDIEFDDEGNFIGTVQRALQIRPAMHNTKSTVDENGVETNYVYDITTSLGSVPKGSDDLVIMVDTNKDSPLEIITRSRISSNKNNTATIEEVAATVEHTLSITSKDNIEFLTMRAASTLLPECLIFSKNESNRTAPSMNIVINVEINQKRSDSDQQKRCKSSLLGIAWPSEVAGLGITDPSVFARLYSTHPVPFFARAQVNIDRSDTYQDVDTEYKEDEDADKIMLAEFIRDVSIEHVNFLLRPYILMNGIEVSHEFARKFQHIEEVTRTPNKKRPAWIRFSVNDLRTSDDKDPQKVRWLKPRFAKGGSTIDPLIMCLSAMGLNDSAQFCIGDKYQYFLLDMSLRTEAQKRWNDYENSDISTEDFEGGLIKKIETGRRELDANGDPMAEGFVLYAVDKRAIVEDDEMPGVYYNPYIAAELKQKRTAPTAMTVSRSVKIAKK